MVDMGALLIVHDGPTDKCGKTCCLDPKRPLVDHELKLLDELAGQGNALEAGLAPDEARKHILNAKYPHFAHFKAFTPTSDAQKSTSPVSALCPIVTREDLCFDPPFNRFVSYSASAAGCVPSASSSLASYVSAHSTSSYQSGAPGQAASPPPAPLRKTSFGPLPTPDHLFPARRPAMPLIPKQMRYYRHHKFPTTKESTGWSKQCENSQLKSISEPDAKQMFPSISSSTATIAASVQAEAQRSTQHRQKQTGRVLALASPRASLPTPLINLPHGDNGVPIPASPHRYLVPIIFPFSSPLATPAGTTKSHQIPNELPPVGLLPVSSTLQPAPQLWSRPYKPHERTPWATPFLSPTNVTGYPSTSTSLPSPLLGLLSPTALLSPYSPLTTRAFPPVSFFTRASAIAKAHTNPTPNAPRSKKSRRRIFRSALLWPLMLPMKLHIRQSLKKSEKPGGKHERGYGKICHCMNGFEEIVDMETGVISMVASRRASVQMEGREVKRRLEETVGRNEVWDRKKDDRNGKNNEKGAKWKFKDLGWT